MIKTSTLSSLKLSHAQQETERIPVKEEHQLPEFEGPSEAAINNILNYSRSLTVMNSEMVRTIEIVSQ
jgi:hypothetical protein